MINIWSLTENEAAQLCLVEEEFELVDRECKIRSDSGSLIDIIWRLHVLEELVEQRLLKISEETLEFSRSKSFWNRQSFCWIGA